MTAFAAALILSGAAPAFAEQTPPPETAAQKTADRDFGKLSIDGQSALRDIRTVRLDIFNGQITGAKTNIAQAVASLNKAQSDETVFTKAESDLKPPAPLAGKTSVATTPSTTPVKWLPVDGAMTLDQDYVATPEKKAGVNQANEKLTKGDRNGAMDALRIAHVDVDFLVELAPLKATTDGVRQASDELNAGRYYEANQSLKAVEDGMRFDSETFVASPQAANSASATAKKG